MIILMDNLSILRTLYILDLYLLYLIFIVYRHYTIQILEHIPVPHTLHVENGE